MARDALFHPKNRVQTRTWAEWWEGDKLKPEMQPGDAAQSLAVTEHFREMLDLVDPPDSFSPTEVTLMLTPKELKSLGFLTADQAIPAVYMLAFERREFGECELLYKKDGKLVPESVTMERLKGPITIRRVEV